jgi:HEAT repeat protein
MKSRRVLWLGAFLVLVAGAVALFAPGSPVNLLDMLGLSAQYEGRTLRAWRKDLKSDDPDIRGKAVFSLGVIGTSAEEAVPDLAEVLVSDPSPGVRAEAALSLFKIAPASHGAVPALAQALDDETPLVRINAVVALRRLKEAARPAIPELIRAMQDERNQTNADKFPFTIQEGAARALGSASAGTDAAVPALTTALKNAETYDFQMALVRALGEVGKEAGPAVPLIRKLHDSGDNHIREVATEALKQIGSPIDDKAVAHKDMELPQAERQYLWEIEHHGNLLVKYGFHRLAAAITRGEESALAELLATDFRGADLNNPNRIQASTSYADVERLEDSGQPPAPLSREAFIARLLSFRKLFAHKPPQVKLALMTLRPTQRGKLTGEWEGTTQLRLHGEHAKGAPAEVVVLLRYRIPAPTQETLSRPGWLREAAVLQVLTAKAPHYLFAEVARKRGLNTSRLHDNWTAARFTPSSGGVYVCDFNRDGILDVLITDTRGCTLYQGRPDGTFEDVTARCGLPRWAPSFRAAWVDIDGDGWEDLILADRVYRNDGGRRFVDYTEKCNLRLPGDANNIVVADFDRDGKMDLYVTRATRPGRSSWLDAKSSEVRGNYLFRNKGGWQFEDVTKASGTGGGRRSTFSAAWLDANNDGWPDLHVINEFGDGVLLLNNRNGTFSPQRLADRPADFGSMGVTVGDVDNDGNIDIFCGNMYSKAGSRVIGNLAPDAYPPDVMEKMRRFVAGSQLHLNRGGGKFEQVGQKMQVAAVGWSYGACLADLDNDGFLDLYATAGYVSRNRNEPDG